MIVSSDGLSPNLDLKKELRLGIFPRLGLRLDFDNVGGLALVYESNVKGLGLESTKYGLYPSVI